MTEGNSKGRGRGGIWVKGIPKGANYSLLLDVKRIVGREGTTVTAEA